MIILQTRLTELRKEKGWTIRELAERSDVPRSTIGCIETGDVIPRIDTVLRLSCALECTVEKLFWMEQESKKNT